MDPHNDAGRRRTFRALLRPAVLALLSAAALPVPGAQTGPPAATLSVDQVKAGQKGKGRTVFERDAIEEFDVEILGVLNNQSPSGTSSSPGSAAGTSKRRASSPA